MAFLLSKNNYGVLSRFRSHTQRRVRFGCLYEDYTSIQGLARKPFWLLIQFLSRFKSIKKSMKSLKRIGDVLSIVVVAGCCYEIYVKATMREEARGKAATDGGSV